MNIKMVRSLHSVKIVGFFKTIEAKSNVKLRNEIFNVFLYGETKMLVTCPFHPMYTLSKHPTVMSKKKTSFIQIATISNIFFCQLENFNCLFLC